MSTGPATIDFQDVEAKLEAIHCLNYCAAKLRDLTNEDDEYAQKLIKRWRDSAAYFKAQIDSVMPPEPQSLRA
jgi:hypothetical protein